MLCRREVNVMSKKAQVKIFCNRNYSELEKEINTFLQTLSDEMVHDIKYFSNDRTFEVLIHYSK
uniref:sporulation protein Cse60 n=1 Tax=Paenibacillus sp. FSL P2-0322 TaxID=2921628 RepID=UPI00403EA33F